ASEASRLVKFTEKKLRGPSCDREPIHIPESIQPHGVLLVVDRRDFNIRQSAGDSLFLLGVDAHRMARLSLYNLFDEQVLAPITEWLRVPSEAVAPYVLFGLTPRSGPFPLDATIHANGEFGIIELEPARRGAIGGRDPLAQIELMVSSLQSANDLNELCRAAATQLRTVNGFDRVMVYRFLDDDSGVVIAEDRAPGVDSFLGLRYPASDIPKQARELYRRNWLRLIPDINYVPAPLDPKLAPGSQLLDMSQCCLRSVSPIHLEYLRNMGVAASMSVSILLKGRLWGLFACHNYCPRYMALDLRVASKLFAQIFSLHLEARIESGKSLRRILAGHVQDELSVRLTRTESIGNELVAGESRLLSLIPAGGLAVLMGGKLHTAGNTPPAEAIAEVVGWLNGLGKPVTSSHQLGLDFPPATPYCATASGLLAVALSRVPADYVIWFRPEMVSTVNWAGNPEKAVTVGPLGNRLTPRTSFETWQQEVRLQSERWDEADIETAKAFRGWLLEAVLYQVDLARAEREAASARQDQLVAELELALVDVTAVSQAKAAELAAQEASRSKSEFLASMSHEIRTPMNGIIGLTHSLRRLVSDPVQSDKLEKIDLTANHLLGIIDNILDISKIEAGKLSLHSDVLGLSRLLDGVVFQLSPQAECKGLTLTVDVDATIPEQLQGDALRISQCLINYISNAIKFTETGAVTVRVVQQTWDEAGILLRFEVEDAGIGIEAEAIPRLFAAFEQADKTTTRRFGGTGLGLALTSQLARLMGGEVGVDSTLAKGSRFWFTALLLRRPVQSATPGRLKAPPL
ncbi:MAG: ATP-binding protein, partial [Rhodospirillaceae bacterium]